MKVTTAQEIGLAIRGRRQELGLGQQTLADRVGVSRQWIVEIEQGKPRAEIALLLRTLDALALQVSLTPRDALRESAVERRLGRDVDIDVIVERARRWKA